MRRSNEERQSPRPGATFVLLVLVTSCAKSAAPELRDGARAERSAAGAPSDAPAERSGSSGGESKVESDPFDELERDSGQQQSIPECFELRGSGGCTGTGAVMLACNALGSLLNEPERTRFVGCLTAMNGTEKLCSASSLKSCVLSAIEKTPVLPGTGEVCDDILSRCPAPEAVSDVYTPRWCRAALSSLGDASRRELVECMTKRCDLTLCGSQLW